MGYGKKLQDIIDHTPRMSVNKLAGITKIPASTLYSIISRDSPIRYDFALRIANALQIEVSELCDDNPYRPTAEVFPDFPETLEKIFPNGMTNITIEHHLKPVLLYLGGKEAANIERILTTYAKLTNAGREAVFDSLNSIEKIATDPVRAKEISEKILTFKKVKE